jgi:hypothetical protein
LSLQPDQHWAAWLLATVLHDDPEADLAELEGLCRKAVAWQRRNELDASRQTWLLCATLQRAGKADEVRAVARAYVASPDADAEPAVLAALRAFAGA